MQKGSGNMNGSLLASHTNNNIFQSLWDWVSTGFGLELENEFSASENAFNDYYLRDSSIRQCSIFEV